MPKLSKVIAKLQRIQEEHGDLEVKTKGYVHHGYFNRGWEEIPFSLEYIKIIRPKTDKVLYIE